MKRSTAFVFCAVLLGAGCNRSPDGQPPASAIPPELPPFLGVPEDSTRKIQDDNPNIDSRLLGVTTMTEVQTVDGATFARFKKDGLVDKEEVRGEFVYFSVNDLRTVPLAGGGAGAAGGAAVKVVSRYKAPWPNNN